MYCGKEFHYPSILKRHLRLKNMCSKRVSPTTDRVSPTSDRVSPTTDRVSDQFNKQNTVPIHLSLG